MNSLVYCTYSIEILERTLKTSSIRGLSQEQVEKLRLRYGQNTIETSERLWPALFKRQWTSPFMYLLITASVASFLLESRLNGAIIFGILLINGLLGFYQEYRASKAAQLLKEHLQKFCIVIRDGKTSTVAHKELVPGDLIVLEQGYYVPADARIVKGQLSIDESLLSGEAYSATKNSVTLAKAVQDLYGATNIAFCGTMVTAGSALAIVVATGAGTLFGELTVQTTQSIQYSGFQERLASLSNFILIMVTVTLPCIFISHLLIKGGQVDMIELLLFSIALIIGLTPEALPTVMTFALSKGALILAHHNIIIKRLSSIEDLGSITLLCTDKTGTLTENKLNVVSWHEFSESPLRLYALLASHQQSSEPFDQAIWQTCQEADKAEINLYTMVEEWPFDPAKKSSAIMVKKGTEQILIVRGALEELVRRSSKSVLSPEVREWLNEQDLKGNRILAVGYKKGAQSVDDDITLAGLIAFSDPIKPTTVRAIKHAQDLQVTIKMITGDSKEVARYVAQAIGLDERTACVMTGAEFETLSLSEQREALKYYSVFARCLPAHKLQIVELLRENHTVGFLGDGINDAPALKAAHVGMVVQKGSDLAKDAADIILKGKSLNDIIYGIEIGRTIFANTFKYLVTSIASNFGNFYSIALASLFIDFLPLLPRQILLINMLTDFPMVALATDTVDYEELQRPPKFNSTNLALRSTILGMVSSVFDFIFFGLFYHAHPAILQTGWFVESTLSEVALIFSLRTRHPFYKARRPSSLLLLLSTITVCVTIALPLLPIGNLFFSFARLSWHEGATIGAILIGYCLVTDSVKVAFTRFMNGNHTSSPQASRFM